MPNRADALVSAIGGITHYNGAGTSYVVETPSGVLYCFFQSRGSTLCYRKSTNGGLTWGNNVLVPAAGGTVVLQFAVWYDKWSGLAGDLIHIAHTDTTSDDIFYRALDTSNDTLGTETTIAVLVSTGSNNALSLTRARGGNLACLYSIDGAVEHGFATSTDVGATWSPKTSATEAVNNDQWILLPGWAADSQDLMCFFWDHSASEISRKLFDDSANTWSETSIALSMTLTLSSTSAPHFSAAVDLANSRNLLAAWSAADTLNADLRAWHVTESAITEVTNVVLNSTDDQHLCGIGVCTRDANLWCVVYAGKSDGSETVPTTLNIYCKWSTDAGVTWGTETKLTEVTRSASWLVCCPRFVVDPRPLFYHLDAVTSLPELYCNVPNLRPRAASQLGF